MSPEVLAQYALTFLLPIFTQTAETLIEDLGKATYEKMKQVRDTIASKFKGDDEAQESLERLEKKPDAESRLAAVEAMLTKMLENDAEFATRLQSLTEKTLKTDPQKIIQTINTYGGYVGKSVQIGIVDGNVSF